MVVYKITNLVNGKVYVGQTTKGAEYRFRQHISDSKRTKGYGCTLLQRAMRRHGVDNFRMEVLGAYSSMDDLCKAECTWIEVLRARDRDHGYNITLGGDTTKGRVVSAETRKKMSDAFRGRVFSDETRRRMSESAKGRSISKESVAKRLITMKGYHHSDETRRKIGNGNRGKHPSLETRAKIAESWVLRRARKLLGPR